MVKFSIEAENIEEFEQVIQSIVRNFSSTQPVLMTEIVGNEVVPITDRAQLEAAARQLFNSPVSGVQTSAEQPAAQPQPPLAPAAGPLPVAPGSVAKPAGVPGSQPPAPEVELDKNGIPWDARIHTSTKKKTTKGLWKRKPGVDPKLVEEVLNTYKSLAETPTDTGAATPQPAPAPAPAPAGESAGKSEEELANLKGAEPSEPQHTISEVLQMVSRDVANGLIPTGIPDRILKFLGLTDMMALGANLELIDVFVANWNLVTAKAAEITGSGAVLPADFTDNLEGYVCLTKAIQS